MDLFRSWDTDAGAVTREELERALKCLGIDPSRGDLDAFVAGLEPDDSAAYRGVPPGSISFRALQRAPYSSEQSAAKIASHAQRWRAHTTTINLALDDCRTAFSRSVSAERAAAGREAALRALLEHADDERERSASRQAELEEEVANLKERVAELQLEVRSLRGVRSVVATPRTSSSASRAKAHAASRAVSARTAPPPPRIRPTEPDGDEHDLPREEAVAAPVAAGHAPAEEWSDASALPADQAVTAAAAFAAGTKNDHERVPTEEAAVDESVVGVLSR
jgi:hypothetical protein